jgi:hypothetical protein
MCQMCEEYDAELQRMARVAEIKTQRDQRQRQDLKPAQASRADTPPDRQPAPPARA